MDNLLKVLTRDELYVLTLRSLYQQYGYSQYKMSKFEEYELYVRNKDFLVSDNVITFTDTDGRLLALKPDVTLSIIKSNKDNPDGLIKSQYNENVYRISGSTHSFGELMQVGLECIGRVGKNEICEVLYLAARSLSLISERNILAISELDIAEGLCEYAHVGSECRKKVLSRLGQKNCSGILEALRDDGVEQEKAELIASLASVYGSPESVIPRLCAFRVNEKTKKAIDSLIETVNSLKAMGVSNISIDFSLVGNMKYYNGIIFKGFIDTVPSGVISGGQYDNLMRKMGRSSRAIGFAVYLDELDRLPSLGGAK